MRKHFLLLCVLQLHKFTAAVRLGYGRKVPIPAGGRAQYLLLNKDTYQFGYDTGTGPSQSFREETRDSDGTVRGRYGYIDPLGALHIIDYMADHTGYHILSTLRLTPEKTSTVGPSTPRTTTTRPTRSPKPRKKLPFLGAIPPFLPRHS